MKIRSNGVVKLSFNGKSRNTSLFTYNLQKETQEQLDAKLREKIIDFFEFYSTFENQDPIKNVEIFSGDYLCTNSCKIDLLKTKISVMGILFTPLQANAILKEEANKFGIALEFSFS
jgi:hypothetical protein